MNEAQLIIVGAGGMGGETYWSAMRAGRRVVGFLDDTPEKQGQTFMGLPILGPIGSTPSFASSHEFVVAIGSPFARKSVVDRLSLMGAEFTSVIDPTATVSGVTHGAGVIICAGVIATTNVVIGSHVILNTRCTVAHDARIGDFVIVSPHALVLGGVVLEEFVDIGAGASIREKICVGHGAVVGMGGIVVKDVPARTVVVGNPARPIGKERSAAS